MRLIDADRLLEERRLHLYYHLPNGDTAIPIIDIKNAPTVNNGGWIPVSERLPEYTSQYLVWVGVNPIGMGMWMEQRTANFNTVTKRFSVDQCCKNEIIGNVEKWMELPKPPKDGDGE